MDTKFEDKKKNESSTSKEKEILKKNPKKLWVLDQSGIVTPFTPEMDTEDIMVNSMVHVDEFITMEMPVREIILYPWLKSSTVTLISAERGGRAKLDRCISERTVLQ